MSLRGSDLQATCRLDYDSVELGEVLSIFDHKVRAQLSKHHANHAQVILTTSDDCNVHYVEENVADLV